MCCNDIISCHAYLHYNTGMLIQCKVNEYSVVPPAKPRTLAIGGTPLGGGV